MMLDPVELAVLGGRLQQVVDEMDLIHTKSAVSPVISEMLDRASAIVDVNRGEVVVQGETGLPMFISAMQDAARSCLSSVGAQLLAGDVLVMNDPYLGGTHLPDMKLISPWFHDGEIVFLLVNTGHYVDVGAASAGAFDPGTTDIFQEGLRIPPTWMSRGGDDRRDVVAMITANTRLPSTVAADLMAQRNALEMGARRLDGLAEEFGIDAMRHAVAELSDRAETQMRADIAAIPDGRYPFRDVVEVEDDEFLDICLAVTVEGDTIAFDFSGSSPAYPGPMNLSRFTTKSATFVALKHLFPDVPNNGGCFRPVDFVIPAGTFLSAEFPSAVGGYTEGSCRVVDAVHGALAEALPDRACAATFGTAGVVTVSGRSDVAEESYFTAMFPMAGGYGGTRGHPGLVHGPSATGTARLPSIESSEADLPIVFEELSISSGSGGRGQWCGGDGSLTRFRALSEVTVSFLGSRTRSRPFGVNGGEAGSPAAIRASVRGSEVGGPGTTSLRNLHLQRDDWFEWRSPGGGGWGRPEATENVVRNEVSPDADDETIER